MLPLHGIHRSSLTAAIAISVGTWSSVGFASNTANKTLEEVVVYAQKREQSIMQVPVSVSSYDSDMLEQAQVRDVADLQQVSPSLSVNSSSGGSESIFAIRGIGTAGNNVGLEQSVGVFIDGVYRGRPGSALSDYVDVEGIEILKGPQGTLFGRNTSAGVISVRTAAPAYDAAAGIDVSVGEAGYFQTKAFSTGALVDNVLAYRLAGSYQEKDGYINDVGTGKDLNDKDRYALRGQLLWDIDDTKSLRLIADYAKSDELCCASVPVFQGPAQGVVSHLGGISLPGVPGSYGGASGTFIDSFDRKTALGVKAENAMKDYGFSVEFNWAFESTELTVISAYRNFEDTAFNDADATSVDLLTQKKTQEIDELSLEVRLASTGMQTVDWLAGFYYFDQDIDYKHPLLWGADARAYYDVALLGNVGHALLSEIEAGLGEVPGTYLAADDYTSTETDYTAESMALFGQATWNLDDQLSMTLGLRYSDEEKEADYHWDGQHPYAELTQAQIVSGLTNACTSTALTPVAQSLQIGARYNDFSSQYDDDNISATVSVNYLWSNDFSTYARFAQGYKSGGLNMDRTAGGQSGGNPVVNPDGAAAQIESGVIYGLTAALYGDITIEDGAVVQENFPDYDAVRLAQTPEIDIHFMESDAPFGGLGGPGTPCIAPAVANALFTLTGQRVRSLPLMNHDFKAGPRLASAAD